MFTADGSEKPRTRRRRAPSLALLWIIVGFLVVVLVGGAIAIWWVTRPPPKTSRGTVLFKKRLWGQVAQGGTTGLDVASSTACQSTCAGSDGWAYWVNGTKCWCVNQPWKAPALTDDVQWISGILKGPVPSS
jgi:hypothetical protein